MSSDLKSTFRPVAEFSHQPIPIPQFENGTITSSYALNPLFSLVWELLLTYMIASSTGSDLANDLKPSEDVAAKVKVGLSCLKDFNIQSIADEDAGVAMLCLQR